MNEEIIIYVAGNPSLYPIEYYDPESESYQGVIPELLRKFSEQTGYDVRYYQAGEEDRRADLAEHQQVDLISGCPDSEEYDHVITQSVTVYETAVDGQEIDYRILFTDVAPQSFVSELTKFFWNTNQPERTGMLLKAAGEMPADHRPWTVIAALSAVAAVLAALLVVIIFRYRKRLKSLEDNRETDSVTGLGNIDYLERNYKTHVNDKNRILYHFIYFYLETARMERIGSHDEMNEFLKYTAVVMNEHIADTDILARVEGGFVVLKLSGEVEKSVQWAMPILERIRNFSRHYSKPFDSGAAVGIYPLKAEDWDLNDVLFNAGECARAACREGEDYKICTDEVIGVISEERRLQKDIGNAFEKEEFKLYIQFYVDTRNYQIVGGESLSRWEHPEKGFLMPGRFVSLMEREGIVARLDYYCMEKSCQFLEELHTQGVDHFFMSCNFSRKTFADENFTARCREIIGKFQCPRELLILEMTESISAKDTAQVRRNVIEMKEFGVRVILDDFGEGFTSFYDLQDYPIDGLKLDKSLIDHMETDKGRAILNSMIQVGHNLGLTILAEGVEMENQVHILKECGCDVIQGFHFHHPIPSRDARKKILEQFSDRIE